MKTVEQMTDDELEKVLNSRGYSTTHIAASRGSPVAELWRRYVQLQGEFFARRDNL